MLENVVCSTIVHDSKEIRIGNVRMVKAGDRIDMLDILEASSRTVPKLPGPRSGKQ
jgi:hypothetical protein